MFLQNNWLAIKEHFRSVFAIAWFMFFWVILPICAFSMPTYFFIFTPHWFVALSYIVIYIVWSVLTSYIPERGGLPFDYFRTCWPWGTIRDYFSHQIIKTAELPPDRNYIIGSHPHGILAVAGTLTFAGKVSGFNELFPGLEQCITTLGGQFRWPYRRETMMFIGVNSCSSNSIDYLLKNPGYGRAIGIVIGGLSESLMSRPGRYDLKIKNRKGFIREAIVHGADLVPCYHFGETDVFSHEVGADERCVKTMQARLRNIIGFVPPFVKGESMIGLGLGGLLPYRRPITSVIGAPIRVTQNSQPSEKEVDQLHATYCDALCQLFEEHKHRHSIPKEHHITIF